MSSSFTLHPLLATRLRTTRLFATNSTASPADVDVGVDRLEPRVEERNGYWILKEKFRQGLNPQEKVKIEKEPMKLAMEGGIEELAKMSIEELDKEKLSKDDVDVRLKWLGLFHRRKTQYGRFMMRLKLPNGVTTSAHTRYLASVIQQYGEEGCADITTRQNWQIRGAKNGKFGFNLLVGGFFSAKRCEEAIPLDAWVSADDVVASCGAVLEAFRDLGSRGNRQKTRMMW